MCRCWPAVLLIVLLEFFSFHLSSVWVLEWTNGGCQFQCRSHSRIQRRMGTSYSGADWFGPLSHLLFCHLWNRVITCEHFPQTSFSIHFALYRFASKKSKYIRQYTESIDISDSIKSSLRIVCLFCEILILKNKERTLYWCVNIYFACHSGLRQWNMLSLEKNDLRTVWAARKNSKRVQTAPIRNI